MPSGPEFTYTCCRIGVFKVLHELKAHGLCRSYRNVGISAEVEKDLEGKENRSDAQGNTLIIGVIIKNLIDKLCQSISNNNLFK